MDVVSFEAFAYTPPKIAAQAKARQMSHAVRRLSILRAATWTSLRETIAELPQGGLEKRAACVVGWHHPAGRRSRPSVWPNGLDAHSTPVPRDSRLPASWRRRRKSVEGSLAADGLG